MLEWTSGAGAQRPEQDGVTAPRGITAGEVLRGREVQRALHRAVPAQA